MLKLQSEPEGPVRRAVKGLHEGSPGVLFALASPFQRESCSTCMYVRLLGPCCKTGDKLSSDTPKTRLGTNPLHTPVSLDREAPRFQHPRHPELVSKVRLWFAFPSVASTAAVSY